MPLPNPPLFQSPLVATCPQFRKLPEEKEKRVLALLREKLLRGRFLDAMGARPDWPNQRKARGGVPGVACAGAWASGEVGKRLRSAAMGG